LRGRRESAGRAHVALIGLMLTLYVKTQAGLVAALIVMGLAAQRALTATSRHHTTL